MALLICCLVQKPQFSLTADSVCCITKQIYLACHTADILLWHIADMSAE